jgi:hypothetical protein
MKKRKALTAVHTHTHTLFTFSRTNPLLSSRLIKKCSVLYCFHFFRDDDKFGRRERYSGPTSDFKEKDGYKPNVKLDYIDDDGHVLNAKEAFR